MIVAGVRLQGHASASVVGDDLRSTGASQSRMRSPGYSRTDLLTELTSHCFGRVLQAACGRCRPLEHRDPHTTRTRDMHTPATACARAWDAAMTHWGALRWEDGVCREAVFNTCSTTGDGVDIVMSWASEPS